MKIFKVGLLGGFIFFLPFAMFVFIFAIPFLYVSSLISQANPWYIFYENWLWHDLITRLCEGFLNFKVWKFFIFVFILGFVVYFRLAILKSKSDFS